MADEEDRRRAGAADQLLDGVGVPGERVDVVGRLLREPEAEEVEGSTASSGRSSSSSRQS